MILEPTTIQVPIGAPRGTVYQAVTSVGAWWPHRRHHDSQVALEPWVGGQFFETWTDGGRLLGTVTEIEDCHRLTVSAAPATEGPAFWAWSIDLSDAGRDRTTVALTYRALAAGDNGAAQRADTAYWERVLDALGRHLRGPENVRPLRPRHGLSAETS